MNSTTINNTNRQQPPTTIRFSHNQQLPPLTVGTANPSIQTNRPVAVSTTTTLQGKRPYENTLNEGNPIKRRRIDSTPIVSDKPVSLEDYLNKIKKCLALNLYASVIDTATHGLKLYQHGTPRYYDLYYYLCYAYYFNNDYELAIKTAEDALNRISNHSIIFQQIARAYETKIKLNSCLCVLYNQKGDCFTAEIHGEEALYISNGSENISDNIKARLIVNLSNTYNEQKKYAQAETIITEGLIKLKDIDVAEKIGLYCNLSIALLNLREYKRLMTTTQTAIEIPGIGDREKQILLENFYQASKYNQRLAIFDKKYHYSITDKLQEKDKTFELITDILFLELEKSDKEKLRIFNKLSAQGNAAQLSAKLSQTLNGADKDASDAIWEALDTLKKYRKELDNQKK